MKLAKKLIALTLAIMMVAVLGVAVVAAGSGKIIIENASGGKEYKVYKIFDASYDPASTSAASYYIDASNTTWLPKVEAATVAGTDQKIFTVSATSNPKIKLVKKADGVDSKEIINWLNSDDIKSFVDGLAPTAEKTADASTIEFDGLDYGYYYVTSSLGATVTITNVQSEKTIYDKNVTPSWGKDGDTEGGKYIVEGGNLVKNNSTEFGKVDYKIVTYNAPNYYGAKKIAEYVIEDTAGSAIYADLHSMKVFVNGTEIKGGWIIGCDGDNDSDHAVDATDGVANDDCNWFITNRVDNDGAFSITIKWQNADESFRYTKADGTPNKIEIAYSATFRSNATIGKDAQKAGTSHNINSAKLNWNCDGATSGSDDNISSVYSSVYALTLVKSDSTTNERLAGAEFQFKRENGDVIKLYKSTSTGTSTTTHVYYVVNDYTMNVVDSAELKWDKTSEYESVVTPDDGTIVVVGLAEGEYQLFELTAPAGYNLLPAAESVSVNDGNSNRTVSKNDIMIETVRVEIQNSKGTVLPETGGTGTIIFIVVGAVAVIGAGLFLVTNKRMSKEGI